MKKTILITGTALAVLISVLVVIFYINETKFSLIGKWKYESLNQFRPVQIKEEEIEVEFFENYYLYNNDKITIKNISVNEKDKTVELITDKNTIQITIINNNRIRFKQPDNKIGTKNYIRIE